MSYPAVSCEIAFPANPGSTGAPAAKRNVTEYLREAHPSGGRGFELDLMDAGACPLTFWDPDRRFEPDYSGSPYYPYVIPMRQMWLQGTWPLNLMRPADNSGFERGDFLTADTGGKGWTTTKSGPATWSVISNATLEGAKVARLTQPGGGAAGTGEILSDYIPIQAGEVVTLALKMRNQGAQAGSQSIIRWYAYNDRNQRIATGYLNAIGGLTLPANGGNVFDLPAAATVQTYGGWFVTPAKTAYVQISVIPYGSTAAARDVYVDAFSLRPGQDATPYAKGILYDLFSNAFVAPERWPVNWARRSAEITADCVDGMAVLNQRKLYHYFAEDYTGLQIGKMADLAGWPAGAAWRLLDKGQAIMQEITIDGEDAGSHMQQAADSELGVCFTDAAGRLRFMDRETRRNQVVKWTFSNDPDVGGGFLYVDAKPNTSPIYNDISIVLANAVTPITPADAAAVKAAQARFGNIPSSLARSPLCAYGTEGQAQADYFFNHYKDPNFRIEEITIDPLRDDALWPIALAVARGDRIKVRHVAAVGASRDFDCLVEGVAHDIVVRDNTRTWQTRLSLSPANTSVYGKLGNASLGRIGTTYKLGL